VNVAQNNSEVIVLVTIKPVAAECKYYESWSHLWKEVAASLL